MQYKDFLNIELTSFGKISQQFPVRQHHFYFEEEEASCQGQRG